MTHLKSYLKKAASRSEARCRKLLAQFQKWKIDALLIEDPLDIYYLTEMKVSRGILLVQERETTFFVDGRYFEACKATSPYPLCLYSEKMVFQALQKIKRLGFDSEMTSYERYEHLKKGALKLIPCKKPCESLRSVKDPFELSKIKKSAALLWKGFEWIKTHLKEGIRECDIAFEFEMFVKKHGASKLSFDPIIAFGKNTAYPHYHTGKAKLKKNDPVLIDIGVVLDDYCSDMTRTLFFGRVDPEIETIYEVVKKAHHKAFMHCKPGVKVSELDRLAREFITQQGYGAFFCHSLGHGVGLEIHEAPSVSSLKKNDTLLKPGMVITIEPGIYLPGRGGVRYEDMVIVTEKGAEKLFKKTNPFYQR